ncbi:MAG: hypothetical protein RL367_1665 [Pseudomonadota bacterium]
MRIASWREPRRERPGKTHLDFQGIASVLGDWIFWLFGPTFTARMMEKTYPPSPERDALVTWMDDQGRFRGFGEALLNNVRHYDAQWQPDAYRALGKTNA